MPEGAGRFDVVSKMANWTEELTREDSEIETWRRDQLVRAGFSSQEAQLLAARTEIDLHTAVELVERGCEPALALRILL